MVRIVSKQEPKDQTFIHRNIEQLKQQEDESMLQAQKIMRQAGRAIEVAQKKQQHEDEKYKMKLAMLHKWDFIRLKKNEMEEQLRHKIKMQKFSARWIKLKVFNLIIRIISERYESLKTKIL